MRTLSVALLSAASLLAQNSLTQKEIDDGWILLFDGQTTFGWYPMGDAKWTVQDGALVSDQGGPGWLRSGAQFADYTLSCEFRTGEKGNSGIFVRSAKDGQPHVTGYEVQIWNEHPKFPNGSLVNHVATKKRHKLKADQWNQLEITIQGGRYQIKFNGTRVLDTMQSKTKVGHIGLQHNKDLKIEFRNIKLKPLGLAPLFNGKDLSGWREVKAPKPREAPVWTAKNGVIHVEKGPGQLETEAQFDDLILQLGIRTHPRDANHHPNSGVFFRGNPEKFWTGYETQIRNEFRDGDRTKPVDFGTGGVYHYQPARRVVPNDGEFFVKTAALSGKHIAVWINGYPVSDWDDPHPEGDTVARNKQSKTAAGVISLQAHDPTTNLDFRNIRAVRLPR
ncbi:MAG: DUF1080 domain-containing protein [Acidobacteria bacterium]|nr:DUF1080 domain-containing protein [Acidobacteriota bacterium]